MNILKFILSYRPYFSLYKIYQKLDLKRLSVDDKYKEKHIKEIFSQIYDNTLWAQGGGVQYLNSAARFYSGPGSYNKASAQYVQYITQYVNTHRIKSVTDIGCGDFNIARQICDQCPDLTYYGVDIVENVIKYNNERFRSEKINFSCLNALTDKIPGSDLLLIRQVLQHLSNRDIAKLTNNCFPGFSHILITESHPKPKYLTKKNVEKSSGPNTRIVGINGSGVYLDTHPFSYNWKKVLAGEDDNPRTEISTFKIV